MTDSPRKDADTDDDDLGLDESLSSMRSMFREMRDEEPSDKGMAALLAAAHAKAAEMKPKRSWFAVLLEQLRRPPVLAMATAVVLVGGAVVISQRDDMKAETDTVSSRNMSAPVEEQAPSPPPADDFAFKDEGGSAPTTGTASAGSSAPEAPITPPVVQQRPRPTPKPGRVRAPSVEEAKPADSLGFEAADPAPAPKLEAKKDAEKAPMAIATDGDMQPKGGATVTEATQSAPQPDTKSVSRKPLPSIEGEDRTAKDSAVAQLVKQCEAAAAKNDCAAVRSIAAKIAKQDPQTYKNRVLKSSSISRCLEPPAPMEAAPEPAN